MDLKYIEHKLHEIYDIRTKILKEMNKEYELKSLKGFSFITKKFYRSFSNLNEMKIACIMDEFTYHSFEPECTLLQITPQNWQQELEDLKPDLFFLESAWNGIEGLWKTKVAHMSDELIEVLNYCRNNDIPIVFWNKEDPVHFDTFIATAKYADFVFTTDIDCIKNYKTLLKHDRVYLMPFAAQTKYHNPKEIYQRQDKFCFAGAYYKRYPDRVKDLETFIDTISSLQKDIDIYDRNYYNQDPNYAFPSSYKKYIIGNLKPDEIDKAYKGYRFNINMNSVKQSQSMCARRIFELLASNTVSVSNYSRAIRNIFGDLVICTDDKKYLSDQLLNFNDLIYFTKFRLLGLRKVLAEHTYGDRLMYLVNKVYENPLKEPPKTVAVIAKASNEKEAQKIIYHFKKQKYEDKKLFIITDCQEKHTENHIEYINSLTDDFVEDVKTTYKYCVFFSAHDYYGENYIFDYILTLKYADVPVLSKGSFYCYDDEGIELQDDENTYRIVNSARVRKSFIQIDLFSIDALKTYINSIDEGIITEECMSIDPYNYCMNFSGEDCAVVDDLVLPDTGVNMSCIYNLAEQIQASVVHSNSISINAEDLYKVTSKSNQITLKKDNNDIYIESHLENSHEYIYFNKEFDLEQLNTQPSLDAYMNVEFFKRFSVDLVFVLFDKNKNRIASFVKPCNRKVSIDVDNQISYLKIGIRLSGRGSCKIKEIILGDIQSDTGCFITKSNVLLITDNYPDYNDLYRYAFIHSRLTEYKNKGQLVDVFKCGERFEKGYSEFNGIDIASGYYEEMSNAIMNGNYDTILIHFLSEEIWSGIKNSVKGRRIIVWVHGAEIQPWWRREYNFTSKQQLEIAKKESDKRLSFWRNIFNLALEQKEYEFQFVFVSDYFAKEVFEDIQITLPQHMYSIIHNYINNDLFDYIEKGIELRKKVLSIRPFANNKYANDLTIKAIMHLAKDPIFKELEFRIVGKGELLHSTVKPIKKFDNVIIEERFLRQEEISSLHKKYGVFLVPTRMDSQGVSRDEAMSSGLVPITNNVAAIPEFVDETCGMLVEAEDYIGLANSIKKLYQEPELFQKLSRNAASRVRQQSGIENTVLKEIELISSAKK